MKQRFNQVDASKIPPSGRSKAVFTTPSGRAHAGRTVATPAPTSGAWLSEALKLWCSDPQPLR